MKPTAKQKKRWERVVALGCLCCRQRPSIHHCRHECGMGQRNHDHVAPLCPECHQHGKISRHGTPKEFTELYGTDKDLHEETQKLLGEI